MGGVEQSTPGLKHCCSSRVESEQSWLICGCWITNSSWEDQAQLPCQGSVACLAAGLCWCVGFGQEKALAASGNSPRRAAGAAHCSAGTGLGTRTWALPPSKPSCARCPGLCNLAHGCTWGMLIPNSPPRGAAGDSPLWIIIPDAFRIAVLSVSLVHGLPIQSDWKKRAFKQFRSLPISYTNALIPRQDSGSFLFLYCFKSETEDTEKLEKEI